MNYYSHMCPSVTGIFHFFCPFCCSWRLMVQTSLAIFNSCIWNKIRKKINYFTSAANFLCQVNNFIFNFMHSIRRKTSLLFPLFSILLYLFLYVVFLNRQSLDRFVFVIKSTVQIKHKNQPELGSEEK